MILDSELDGYSLYLLDTKENNDLINNVCSNSNCVMWANTDYTYNIKIYFAPDHDAVIFIFT